MHIGNKQLLLEKIYWILQELQLKSTHLFQNLFSTNIWVDALSSYGQRSAQTKYLYMEQHVAGTSWKAFRRQSKCVGRKNILWIRALMHFVCDLSHGGRV